MEPPAGMLLAGKVALVTGASRGIGRAIALRFARAGAKVGLLARSQADLEAVSNEIYSSSPVVEGAERQSLVVTGDITSPEDLSRAHTTINRQFGPLDILVNNAGIVLRETLADTTYEKWREVLAVNLDGTFLSTRTFLSNLIDQRGRIINISSIAGRQGTPALTAYCASKHAMVGFTRALAEELRPNQVAVNAICPGSVDTDMLRVGLPGTPPKMTPEDIAETALFLAANAPTALTGSCIDVYG